MYHRISSCDVSYKHLLSCLSGYESSNIMRQQPDKEPKSKQNLSTRSLLIGEHVIPIQKKKTWKENEKENNKNFIQRAPDVYLTFQKGLTNPDRRTSLFYHHVKWPPALTLLTPPVTRSQEERERKQMYS